MRVMHDFNVRVSEWHVRVPQPPVCAQPRWPGFASEEGWWGGSRASWRVAVYRAGQYLDRWCPLDAWPAASHALHLRNEARSSMGGEQ